MPVWLRVSVHLCAVASVCSASPHLPGACMELTRSSCRVLSPRASPWHWRTSGSPQAPKSRLTPWGGLAPARSPSWVCPFTWDSGGRAGFALVPRLCWEGCVVPWQSHTDLVGERPLCCVWGMWPQIGAIEHKLVSRALGVESLPHPLCSPPCGPQATSDRPRASCPSVTEGLGS